MEWIEDAQTLTAILMSFARNTTAKMKTAITLTTKSSKYIIQLDTKLNFVSLTLINLSSANTNNFVGLPIHKLKSKLK